MMTGEVCDLECLGGAGKLVVRTLNLEAGSDKLWVQVLKIFSDIKKRLSRSK
jgi:hypothetical protein